jgi:hypothetical protein
MPKKSTVVDFHTHILEPYVLKMAASRRHCHVNRKFTDQRTMAVTVHAATVAWRHVSIA